MSTFNRYFIHFFTISTTICIIIIFLAFIDSEIALNPLLILSGVLCIIVFTIPMTLFFNNQAQVIQINIENKQEGSTLIQLEDLIKAKFKRTIKISKDDEVIYRMEGRYNQWLTNPVRVIPNKEKITIILPKAYKQEIISRFIEYK